VRASVTATSDGWALTDPTGSLPLLAEAADGVTALLAASAGHAVDVTVEWTPAGVLPLAVHLADRSVDIGPRADSSFVGAA
jgi:hypothetical protein